MKRKILFVAILFFIAAMLFAQSTTVYVTAKGKKYHTASCHTIKNSKTFALSKEQAKSAGYTACKVCNP